MSNFILAILYIVVVIILHFYFVLGQTDLSQFFDSQPLSSSIPVSLPPKPILKPINETTETFSNDYKKNLLNVFDEEEKGKPYIDPIKTTNPDFDELEAYYKKLSDEKFNFEPVPTSSTNDFKTQLFADAKGNLNPEIVYGNITAFEDFDTNYASI